MYDYCNIKEDIGILYTFNTNCVLEYLINFFYRQVNY